MGSFSSKVEPSPARELMEIVPPTSCSIVCTTSSPTPLPLISLMSGFVVKPGRRRKE